MFSAVTMSYSKAKGQAGTLRLSLKNATSVSNQRDATLKFIREALGPLMTFERRAAVLRIFGANGLTTPHNYSAVQSSLRRITRGWLTWLMGAMREVICLIPPHWDMWASCVRKFRVQSHVNWDHFHRNRGGPSYPRHRHPLGTGQGP